MPKIHKARISIIIPSYNASRFISQTLESIISQQYPSYEIIIQDGGSTDGTVDIIKSYAQKYPRRIRWVSHSDGGQLSAINSGLKKATGEIITYLNADDIYYPQSLEQVNRSYQQHPQTLWLAGRGRVINAHNKQIARLSTAYKNYLLQKNSRSFLLMTNYLMQPSVFLTRLGLRRLGQFSGMKMCVMEYAAWLKLSQYQMPVVIPHVLSGFRLQGANITSSSYRQILKEDLQIASRNTRQPILLGLHSLHNFARIITINIQSVLATLLSLSLIAAVVSILYLPARSIKFSWVDDGYVYLLAQKLYVGLLQGNWKDVIGVSYIDDVRLRPVYWFWQAGNFVLSGFNPASHYFWHFILIFVIAVLIFILTKYFTNRVFSAVFASILFLVTPINTENWYRLGPQEPLVTFLVLLSFICWLLFRKPVLGGIVFLFAIFSKEPTIAILVPLYLVYVFQLVISKTRNQTLEKFLLVSSLGIPFVILHKLFKSQGYAVNYNLNLSLIFSNLFSYLKLIWQGFWPYLPLAILVFVFSKSKSIKIIPLLITLAYVAILSPWDFVLDRYLLPASVGVVVFIASNLPHHRFLSLLVVIWFVVQSAYSLLWDHHYGQRMANSTNHIQNLYSYTAAHLPPNSTLLLNFIPGENSVELIFETELQLQEFYHRPDIKVDYFDPQKLPAGKYLVATSSIISPQVPMLEQTPEIINLVNTDYLPIITTPGGIVKQSLTKAYQSLRYHRQPDWEGIYTRYQLSSIWSIWSN